ncbi:hypothetical protein GGD65_003214 [Bradyrhizobium sp. CIR18]|uniref:HNH endonuclease n=1 Tax=Bradyrhizobium sp. CIR18 TaxID=2663839 RepID=UPI0016061FB6|nr:HNH endonuclease signature motif containing protein [Bradyrhizobium sp. CIR18]MBB4362189.1 hypothetical protein [Bradyrhizobium sp. CIR18]
MSEKPIDVTTQIMDGRRAWLAMAFDDASSPYDDQVGVHYDYDSNVQNHKQVKAGDLLFVRSRTELQGVGRIGHIEMSYGEKVIARCPSCGQMVQSRKWTERGRCKRGHEFIAPKLTTMEVRKFRAHFDRDWMPTARPVSNIELKRFHLRRSNQLAIMPVALDEIVSFVGSWEGRESYQRLVGWLRDVRTPYVEDGEPDLTPPGEDHRVSALRAIRLRRGQQTFRLALLEQYASRCVISNCSVVEILEAAHIRPYRGEGDHHPSNGLLLRSDLHTLFDLNLIAINPEDGLVSASERLADSEYMQFDGQQLFVEPSRFPDRSALRARWLEFQAQEMCSRGR